MHNAEEIQAPANDSSPGDRLPDVRLVIGALDVAALVTDRFGCLVCENDAARALLAPLGPLRIGEPVDLLDACAVEDGGPLLAPERTPLALALAGEACSRQRLFVQHRSKGFSAVLTVSAEPLRDGSADAVQGVLLRFFRGAEPNDRVSDPAHDEFAPGGSEPQPTRKASEPPNGSSSTRVHAFSRDFLCRVLEHLPSGLAIAEVGSDGNRVIYANPAAQAITGYPLEELIGQECRVLSNRSGEPPTDANLQELKDACQAGRRLEIRLQDVRKDQTTFWNYLRIAGLPDRNGETSHIINLQDDISSVVAAEHALRLERDVLQTAFDQAPGILFAIDRVGRFLLFNRQLPRTSGYSADDVRHMTLFDFFSGQEREDLQQLVQTAFATESVLEQDLSLVTHVGERVAITLYGRVSQHETNPLMIGLGLNITAMRDSLRAFALSQERLNRSQAFANIGLWDWDLRTDEVYWSDRVPELIGSTTSRMQFGFHEFLSAAHPLDRPRLATSIENCVSGNDVLDEEFRVQRADGSQRWMLARANLLHDDRGEPSRMLGVIQDITPLKHAEFIEKRAREQIQSIIDSLEARICVVDQNGEIISVNRSWQRHPYRGESGQRKSLASGGNYLAYCDALAEAGRADMHRLAEGVRDVLSGVAPSCETEILVARGSREEIHLVRITPLRGSTEKHPCVVINHQDVTKRRQIEQDLRQAKNAAERASRAKSEFLSSMSHELRTPMNAVLGFAQLLEQDDELSADQLENVQEILHAGKHLLHLINEVLDLARVESGRIDLQREAVPLKELVAECLSLLATTARRQTISLEAVDLESISVTADRVRLKQVLINLLSNAIKYNTAGGYAKLTAERLQDGYIRIQVCDNGLGIPEDQIQSLFRPFSRLERDTHTEGTGIGLAVCRRLVEAMDGRIGANSTADKGSCFWLELKAAAEPAEETKPAQDSAALSEPSALPASLKTILQIEDKPSNLKLMDRLLARHSNLQILSAITPTEGIDIASREQPDLILLDIHMPGLNGYQVLAALRADAATKTIPVIAVTANATQADIDKGLAAGFDAYLTKPIDSHELTRTIQRVFARDQSRDQDARIS